MAKKKQILVVDDEANIQEALHGILTDEGYEVCEAENGDDALKLLQEKRIDLVLLDIWLPGRRDGLQTLREMRRRNEKAEVIMISGHGSIDTAVRATKLGAYGFIEKPLSLTVVLDQIEAALQSSGEKDSDKQDSGYDRYIGGCEAMETVKRQMKKAAKSGEPQLIIGEMGSGKEFSAEHIHSMSSRKNNPFITVNCHGLAAPAFNRLFGPPDEDPSSKGSRFSKLAGSLFMEEPHKLNKELRQRLFKLVELSKTRGSKNRLGFIGAATAIRKKRGGFGLPPSLSDLFGNEPIILPPLRERGDDIENFVDFFIENASEDFGKTDIKFSRDAVSRMVKYPWPGNVKELKTLVENSVMSCSAAVIGEDDILLGGPLKKKAAAISERLSGRRGGSNRRSIIRQKSLKQSVVLTGVGLHSGIKTGLILTPLPPNSGIIFGDISTGRQVPANLDNVRSTEFCTMLKFGTAQVMTIEHIMATLHMYGITNALIKVGDEVPIMDGSAAELCELIESAGIENQHEPVIPITIDKKITVGESADNKKFLTIEPADKLIIEYRMDYPPPVGKMRTTFKADSVENFKTEIAPARTFGFVDEIKKIAKKGLGQGGRLTNVILIDDERVINTSLRFEDEFARHKILDFIGDAYLLGRPLYGKVTANMTGHTENVMLLKAIRSSLGMPVNVAAGSA